MDSSTEQLVRDYLNRLAVAARQSLSPGELMSFIARMRSAIERQVGPHGAATPAEVATMLAALGAPKGLVELEQQRLAAAQTDRGRAAAGPARAIEPPIMLPTARSATVATDPRLPALPPGTRRPGPDAARPAASGPGAGPDAAKPAAATSPAATTAAAGPTTAGAASAAAGPAAGSTGPPDSSLAFIAEPVTGPQGSVALARFSQDLPPAPPPMWPPLARSPDTRARPEPGRRLRLRSRTSAQPPRPGRGTDRAPQDQPARGPGDPAGRELGYEPAWGPGDAAGRRDEQVRVTADVAGHDPGDDPARDAGHGSAPGEQDGGGALGPGPVGVPAPEPSGPDPLDQAGPGAMPGLATGYRPEPAPAPRTGSWPVPRPGPAPVPPAEPGPAPQSGPTQGDPAPRDPAPRDPAPREPVRREPVRREPVRREPVRSSAERGPGSDLEIVPGMSARPRRGDPSPARRPMRALPPGVRGQRPTSVSDAARRVWLTSRRQPLEAVAIVVMVLGVLIFPPLWLVGVFLAVLSRFWDLRDKLIALAGPALLTLIGTGVGVATGGTRSSAAAYIRAAGALGTDLITAGAVLGAVYLSWRLARGRRQESTPPWMRTPHH